MQLQDLYLSKQGQRWRGQQRRADERPFSKLTVESSNQ